MATIPETFALAVQYHHAGDLETAGEICRQILAADPNEADAWHLLGLLNAQVGRHQAGVECFDRALRLKPDWFEALYNLGRARLDQGDLAAATACYRRAVELRPDHEEAHNNLGLALEGQGKVDEAAACYRRAIQLNPELVAAHNNLGLVLRGQGKLDEAAACFGRALQVKPDLADAHNNLGNVREDQGKLAEAIACYRRALEVMPECVWAHSNLLCSQQYRGSITLKELADAHAGFEQAHVAPLRATWSAHENVRDPQRRLRVGFVSPDLRRHPVGYFLIRLLENLDQGLYEAICYYDGTVTDDLTARFQGAATAWSDVARWTDEQLARQIRTDRIDVLFDLAGHTSGNRLLVFARKPAPIQVTWAGYTGTTGLAAMDYVLADRFEIPPQSERYYCERVLRMPDGYVCYDPPGYAPPVSPLPAFENGYVTFAAFHNPAKITPQVVEVWAQVFKRLPQARLVLKYRGMDDASVTGRLADLFAGCGIDPARLEFLGFSAHSETLAQYRRVDVALDSFPYNGGLTTCEALWMGVPVVTCPGETFASRHSLSHLSNVGLTETVAGSLEEYVELAVSLAGDLSRLAALRAGLRDRMAFSPLCDGKRFAENFVEILRTVWQHWCEKNG